MPLDAVAVAVDQIDVLQPPALTLLSLTTVRPGHHRRAVPTEPLDPARHATVTDLQIQPQHPTPERQHLARLPQRPQRFACARRANHELHGAVVTHLDAPDANDGRRPIGQVDPSPAPEPSPSRSPRSSPRQDHLIPTSDLALLAGLPACCQETRPTPSALLVS